MKNRLVLLFAMLAMACMVALGAERHREVDRRRTRWNPDLHPEAERLDSDR